MIEDMTTVGRRQQKKFYCILLFIIFVACTTVKMENEFVLQMFVKAANEEGLKKYHNKWLLESSIVKIINAHYELYEEWTVDRFRKALRSKHNDLLSRNNLSNIDNHSVNTSGIFRTTHKPHYEPRVDIYYLHHDDNYNSPSSSSTQQHRSTRQALTYTDVGSNNIDGRRMRRKKNVEIACGKVDSSNPDWYARLVRFDKSLEFESSSVNKIPVPELVHEIQSKLIEKKKRREFSSEKNKNRRSEKICIAE